MMASVATTPTVPMVFERHEQKYVMSQTTYQQLLVALGDEISMDQYGQQTISSLYYDTAGYLFARRQLDDSSYREKLRLRVYGSQITANQAAFVELKKKVKGITYKRRIQLSYQTGCDYLGQQGMSMGRQHDMNYREIDHFVQQTTLPTRTAVIYERTAYSSQRGLRVTFDENIRWRSGDVDLTTAAPTKALLAPGMVVMEIKIPQALPLAWSQIFAKLHLYPQPFSKYGLIYKYGILGGKQCLSAI